MDLITYVEDRQAMYEEAAIIAQDVTHPLYNYFTIDDELQLAFLVTKVPVQYNGNKSITLTRGLTRELIELTDSIEVIGSHTRGDDAYVFDSPEAEAKCEGVRSTTPYSIDDGEGGTYMYTPHKMFGVFA